MPPRSGRALIVIGEAGAGKSRALKRMFETRPEFEGFGEPGCPVLSVVAPSPFTLSALGNEIAQKLGYFSRRNLRQSEVWPLIRGLMQEWGVRILHIDEAQHGDQISNSHVAQEIENTMKRMMQEAEWPIWLILSGLPELARFCQDDASMRRRVRILRFEPLKFPDHSRAVQKLVRQIVAQCEPLECTSLMTDEFSHRLLHAGMYQPGIVVEYVQDAISECLAREEENLVIDHFADVYMSRTGALEDSENVFIASNWLSIHVEGAMFEKASDDVEAAFERRHATGRKRRKLR